MNPKTLTLVLVLFATTAIALAADKPVAKPSTPAGATTNALNTQFIAYYFHGTVRCETCLKIERQASEAIERRFASEVAEKRLVFTPLNYDRSENAHFLQDYKLPCLVEDAAKFNRYIEEETKKFIGLRK